MDKKPAQKKEKRMVFITVVKHLGKTIQRRKFYFGLWLQNFLSMISGFLSSESIYVEAEQDREHVWNIVTHLSGQEEEERKERKKEKQGYWQIGKGKEGSKGLGTKYTLPRHAPEILLP